MSEKQIETERFGVSGLGMALRQQYIFEEQMKVYADEMSKRFESVLLRELSGIFVSEDVLLRRRTAVLRRECTK